MIKLKKSRTSIRVCYGHYKIQSHASESQFILIRHSCKSLSTAEFGAAAKRKKKKKQRGLDIAYAGCPGKLRG